MLNAGCGISNRCAKTILYVALASLILAGSANSADKGDFQFGKQPEIQQVRPAKPVKIKLHRTAKGEYSWELAGDDADEIARTDRKLRKLLKVE